ncbi:unnamed protein product, partial [Didymodactylos carnosus]
RYIESISNHCGQIHLAIIGLIYETTTTTYNKEQVKRLFDSVQNKTEMYLLEHYDDSQNMVEFYSNYFQPIYFNDSPSITNDLIIQLEIIAKKWNNIHEKNKRLNFKRKLNIFNQKNIIIDYNHCRKKFDNKYIQVVDNKTSFDEDEQSSEDIDKENDEENELDPIEFDSCLEFLRLTGDIVWIDKQKQLRNFIIIKPHLLFNIITSFLRSNFHQWLNYEENVLFHYSGYFLTKNSFENDKERLLVNGEYTWKMLNVLLIDFCLNEQQIIEYCLLMERLYM